MHDINSNDDMITEALLSAIRWQVKFRVFRQKGQEQPHYDIFDLEVDPEEYVLDGVERIWAFQDRSLTFRHACHHSTCGACGMRVNGVEKLTCITPIHEVTRNGSTLTIEPLRNFPILSDLVVDMGHFYALMDQAEYPAVTPLSQAPLASGSIQPLGKVAPPGLERLNDCIECGMCISACPIAATSPEYVGPAILASMQFNGLRDHPELLPMADSQDGAWRCHSVYECSEVCPSFVDPAWRIMDLRHQVLAQRIHHFFHPGGK